MQNVYFWMQKISGLWIGWTKLQFRDKWKYFRLSLFYTYIVFLKHFNWRVIILESSEWLLYCSLHTFLICPGWALFQNKPQDRPKFLFKRQNGTKSLQSNEHVNLKSWWCSRYSFPSIEDDLFIFKSSSSYSWPFLLCRILSKIYLA